MAVANEKHSLRGSGTILSVTMWWKSSRLTPSRLHAKHYSPIVCICSPIPTTSAVPTPAEPILLDKFSVPIQEVPKAPKGVRPDREGNQLPRTVSTTTGDSATAATRLGTSPRFRPPGSHPLDHSPTARASVCTRLLAKQSHAGRRPSSEEAHPQEYLRGRDFLTATAKDFLRMAIKPVAIGWVLLGWRVNRFERKEQRIILQTIRQFRTRRSCLDRSTQKNSTT